VHAERLFTCVNYTQKIGVTPMQNKQGEKGCEIEGGGQNTYGYNNG